MKTREDSLEQLIWEMRRVFRELAAVADENLQGLGIRASDRAFLEFLAREPEAVSLSDLARKHSVSRQHMHQTLRRLPQPDWVEEVPVLGDRRAVGLRLSKKGRACWEKIRVVDREFLRRLARRLPQERVEDAADLLKQLRYSSRRKPSRAAVV